MKKTLFLCIVILMVSFTAFSEGMLGLRTVKATETTVEATEVIQENTGLKLNLRTVDPLLQSFKAGFKSPDLPGWSVAKIGNKSVKLPNGFKMNVVQNGLNYDGAILDDNGETFAQIFLYELQAYELEELYDTLMQTLYAQKITDEKEFEEFKDYGNDFQVYFTKQGMQFEKASMPVFFMYTMGETEKDVTGGSVLFLFVEPFNYQAEADVTKVNQWVEGIAGSLIESMTAVEEKTVPEKVEKEDLTDVDKDSFGAWVRDSVKNGQWVDTPPDGWIKKQAQMFQISHPAFFNTDTFISSDFEVMDFEYNGMTIAKVFVGFTAEALTVESVLEELYESYLAGLGDYEIVRQTPYSSDYDGFLITYEIDFDNAITCWITISSESYEENYLEGEYVLFLGISDESEADMWKVIYHSMLMSLSF